MFMNRKITIYTLLSLFMGILSACSSKDKVSNQTETTVEITVKNQNGESIAGETVQMYDKNTYEIFKENPTLKGQLQTITDNRGKAVFRLKKDEWFNKIKEKELMFVVIKGNVPNYQWWSTGGNIKAGKNQSFEIIIESNPATDTSLLIIENDILVGLKDKNLTSVILPQNIKGIADKAFKESQIQTIVLNEGMLSIGNEAFKESKLQSIVFPSTLTSIGRNAFEDCKSIKDIDLSKTRLQNIETETFRESSIAEISFPATLQTIASQAFLKAERLSSVKLPDGIQTVEKEAFCESGITSVTIPNNIKLIEHHAFANCSNLKSVECYGPAQQNNGKMEIGCFQYNPQLSKFTFPESIAELKGWNFIECSSLKEFIIPQNMKSIEAYGLVTNYNVDKITFLSVVPPALKEKALPFYNNIKEIRIPKGSKETYQKQWEGSYDSYLKKVIENN